MLGTRHCEERQLQLRNSKLHRSNRHVNDQSVMTITRREWRWFPGPSLLVLSSLLGSHARPGFEVGHASFRFRKEPGPAGKSPAVRVFSERFAGFGQCAPQLAQLPRTRVKTAGGGWICLKSISPMPAIHRASSVGQMLSN
jgi:hypothetical protein